MNILILVLSHTAAPYGELMRMQQQTWDSIDLPGIETVYYYGGDQGWNGKEFSADSSDEYYEMHWKFKLALDAVWDKPWDMIFRTNSSSYVDKDLLKQFAYRLPLQKCYAGWSIGENECVSGAGFFISRDCADILRNELPAGVNIEEDVLAGRLLKPHGIEIINDQSRCDIFSMTDYRPGRYHYRFKTHERMQDVENMRLIHEMIMK